MNREIGALTGLRGIAAVWVVLHHAQSVLSSAGEGARHVAYLAFRGGYLGVDLFFVLSGFVLALNYGAKDLLGSPRDYAAFLWKRLARIYPTHLAALVLFGASILVHIAIGVPFVTRHDMSLIGLVQSVLLVHAWSIPIEGKWNAVSWSISAEWAAYLAFPLVAYIAFKARSRLVLWTAVAGSMLALGLWFEISGANGFTHGLARIAAEFSAGVMLYRIWSMRTQRSGAAEDAIALVLLVAMIAGAGILDYSSGGDNRAQVYGPAVACVIIYCLASARGPMQRLLCSRQMLHIGRVSYSLYLVHMSFVGLAANYLRQNGTTSAWGAIAFFVASIAFALLCAHWLYASIEEPARRKMLRFYRRGNGAEGGVKLAV